MELSKLELAVSKKITPEQKFKLKSTTLNVTSVKNVNISLEEGNSQEGNYLFKGSAELIIQLSNGDLSSETYKIAGYALIEDKDIISIHPIINIYKINSIGL